MCVYDLAFTLCRPSPTFFYIITGYEFTHILSRASYIETNTGSQIHCSISLFQINMNQISQPGASRCSEGSLLRRFIVPKVRKSE